MNKQTIITILLALVAMTTQGQTFTWRIEGTVANAAPTDTLTVIDAEKQRMITTLQVKALYGSFWWDSNYKICRFCGEKELTEENIMESEYFKHSPHYYIIGAIFSDNTARAIPL